MLKKLELNKENLEYSKELIKIMYDQTTTDEEVLKRFLEILEEFLNDNTKLDDLDKISKDPFINRRMRHPSRIKYIFGRNN